MNNTIRQLAGMATAFCSEKYKDTPYVAWGWEEKFAELIIEECMDIVGDCDPSTKMIPHEPYVSIQNAIRDHFYEEEI